MIETHKLNHINYHVGFKVNDPTTGSPKETCFMDRHSLKVDVVFGFWRKAELVTPISLRADYKGRNSQAWRGFYNRVIYSPRRYGNPLIVPAPHGRTSKYLVNIPLPSTKKKKKTQGTNIMRDWNIYQSVFDRFSRRKTTDDVTKWTSLETSLETRVHRHVGSLPQRSAQQRPNFSFKV